MSLSRRLATAMANGAVDRLPRLTRHASPEFAHALLGAYLFLLEESDRTRANEGASWALADRVAFAAVRAEISAALRDTWDWLRRCARHGGSGLPPSGPFSPSAVRAFLLRSLADPDADRSRYTSPPEGEQASGSTALEPTTTRGAVRAADVGARPLAFAGHSRGAEVPAPS